MSHRSNRVALAVLAAMALVASPHIVRADTVATFDLPAQPLADALRAIGAQTHYNVFFNPALVAGMHAPAVKVRASAESVLRQLLEGTGLTLTVVDDKTFMVASPTESKSGDADPAARAADKSRVMVDEVIVTGSRLARAAKEGAQEVRTYSRQKIDQSGQSTIADFLSTLPEVSMSSIDSAFGNFANQTTVRLHGLPNGTTLVLLNGRRVQINNYGFFDLNNIPVSAIDRVEVLPVGSAAIYGADSLAGAVNIILKKGIDGIEGNAMYGRAESLGETTASLSWGKTFERGSVALTLGYQGRGELLGSERDATSDPRRGYYYYGFNDLCNPGSVHSLNGGNLPGLAAPVAAIPRGLTAPPTAQSFAGTAGTTNECNYYNSNSVLPPLNREGVLASGHYRISDAADLFFEAMYSHERVESKVGTIIFLSSLFGDTLGAGNPYNPFGEDVGISYSYEGAPYLYNRTTTFYRPLVGIRGGIGGDWSYEVTAFLSGDNSEVEEIGGNYGAIAAALRSSDPATALNPFAAGAPGSAALLSSLTRRGVSEFDSSNVSTQALVRGSLFDLPAGPVSTAFGAEFDHSRIHTSVNQNLITGNAYTLSRDSWSLFAETRLPLLPAPEEGGAGERLALSAAARYDNSSDYGSKVTWQGALEWRPMRSLLARAAYATAYQAPQLPQLAGSVFTFDVGALVDPARGNEVSVITVNNGPNPNLRPQTADTLSTGLVYSSERLPGFETSLTYWKIDISDYIGRPAVQDILDNEDLFPGGIVRSDPTPADTQNGYAGRVLFLNQLYFNFGSIDVAGVDWDLRYVADTPVGEFTPSLSVTATHRYDVALAPGEPSISHVSNADSTIGFAPRYKGVASLAWKRNALTLSAGGRYVGKYRDYLNRVGVEPTELGSFWLWDTNARYSLGEVSARGNTLWKGAFMELGAVNLFDRDPQNSISDSGYGFDPAQADIRGRFLYLRAGVSL